MDRDAWSGDFGAWPTRPEWDWLWATLAFCPSFGCRTPYDIAGWMLPVEPLIGPGTTTPTQSWNAYGPAHFCFNLESGAAYSNGWHWATPGDIGKTSGSQNHQIWFDWTLAVGWRRQAYSDYYCNIAHLYSGGFHNWQLLMCSSQYKLGWYDTVQGGATSQLFSPDGSVDASANGPTQNAVIVTRYGHGTTMYYNGREVASASWATMVWAWNLLYLAADVNAKQDVCLGCHLGPFLLSRHAWSADEVAQWADDPYGFLRPNIAPILPAWRVPYDDLICDVQTRSAVLGDVQARSAVLGDAQARSSVFGDTQARSAVLGDVQARSSVLGEVGARSAIAGDIQSRSAVLAKVESDSAVIGDTQTRSAVLGDTQTRSAVLGDVQTRSAVDADDVSTTRGR